MFTIRLTLLCISFWKIFFWKSQDFTQYFSMMNILLANRNKNMFDPFVNENSNPYFHLMNIEALLIDLIW